MPLYCLVNQEIGATWGQGGSNRRWIPLPDVQHFMEKNGGTIKCAAIFKAIADDARLARQPVASSLDAMDRFDHSIDFFKGVVKRQ
ncbi:MAG: hypothetical protein RLZZ627_1955 [Pseudomonadota bacterium]